jgi:16S rRNA (cytidine1402-2'-O)-methyltransferase
VLVIAGKEPKEIQLKEQERWKDISLNDHMDLYLLEGVDKKDAMKRVAKERGTSKREVYRQLLEIERCTR